MADVVVTVPKWFWKDWLAEGCLAGEPYPHLWHPEWVFSVPTAPKIEPEERVYVVAHGRLRGYAPLVEIDYETYGKFGLVRGGGAVAVTISEPITGFRGYRYRWWDREVEQPFPDWKTP